MHDPFCSPGALAKTAFYRSQRFVVLYNIRPISPGHSLFVPYRHVTAITDLDEREVLDLHRTMKRVIPVLTELYGAHAESYNLAVQTGPHSGRSIAHLHIHVIPRSPGDRHDSSEVTEVDIKESAEGLGADHVARQVRRLRSHFGYRPGPARAPQR